MFFLSQLEHKLRLPPHLFDLPLDEAIRGQLESIFLDKVVFRMIMFRPYEGEVIAAKLIESNANGLRSVSLGFFDDIYVPAYLLPRPSHAVPDEENPEQLKWSWTYNDENFHIDDSSEIRFKVYDVKFPPIPLEQEEGSKPFAPMVVTGSIDSDGLGPTAWWL